jgi:hypothetical protein
MEAGCGGSEKENQIPTLPALRTLGNLADVCDTIYYLPYGPDYVPIRALVLLQQLPHFSFSFSSKIHIEIINRAFHGSGIGRD